MSNPVAEIIKRAANAAESGPENAAEAFFDSIGLMRGEYAPVGRAAVGAGVGAAIMWAIRPSFAFDASGNPLPWGKGATATQVPWFVLPVALAIFSGVFV